MEYLVYDKDKMKKLVRGDLYLKRVVEQIQQIGNTEDTALRVTFNSNVLEDSQMTKQYNKQ